MTADERTQPFDHMAASILEHAIRDVLSLCPEVRSVSVAIDYRAGLNNNPETIKYVWLGRRPGAQDTGPTVGRVAAPDAVFGSLDAVLGLANYQYRRVVDLLTQLRDEVIHVGDEVIHAHEELKHAREGHTEPERPGDTGRSPDQAQDPGVGLLDRR